MPYPFKQRGTVVVPLAESPVPMVEVESTDNPATFSETVAGEGNITGMTIYGKSTQVTTTGAQLFDKNAASPNTWINGQGVVEGANGYTLSDYISVTAGTYYGNFKGSVKTATYNSEKQFIRYIAWAGSTPLTINDGESYLLVTIQTNDDGNYLDTFMLNAGSTALPYEPYTGGKPSPSPEYPQEIHSAGDEGEISITLSDGANQSLTFSTPNDLPGIPVDSGGNFVDEDGKNFFSNLRDYFRGVDVTRVKFFHVDTSNTSQWYSLNTGEYVDLYTYLVPNDYQVGYKNIMCNILPYNGNIYAGKNYGCCFNETLTEGGNAYLLFSFDRATFNASKEDSSEIVIEKFKTYMGEDGFDILYICDPIETPIPDTDIAAYRALHAYDGTTVITPQDALAEVEVDYIVKPKAYIEKKLTAIEQKIQEVAAAQIDTQTGG